MSYPGDTQMMWDNDVGGELEWVLRLRWSSKSKVTPTVNDPVSSGVVLCAPNTQPAPFLARFGGLQADPVTGDPATVGLDITVSGRLWETVHSAAGQYEGDPGIVYQAPTGNPTKLMLAQELQSTGDDTFLTMVQTRLIPTFGKPDPEERRPRTAGDTSRIESLEPLIRRGVGQMPGVSRVAVVPVTSNVLTVQGGTIGTATEIPDLNSAPPVKAPVTAFATGRFVGLQVLGTNLQSIVRYLGAYIRGRRQT